MTPLPKENAELVAIEALAWLVGNEELLQVFQGASGASEADIRAGAKDPVFLGSILDFLMMDDTWVTSFCETAEYAFDFPMRARAALPGGEHVNWT